MDLFASKLTSRVTAAREEEDEEERTTGKAEHVWLSY